MWEYRCKIVHIVDGDTVDVDIDLGFGIELKDERVRIMGIDTPESRTRDLIEKQFGLAATERCKELLPVGSTQTVITKLNKEGEDMKGKFGRVLGDFVIGNTTYTETLIAEHFAVRYEGQAKEDIEAEHLRNREILLESGTVKLDPDFE
jgi:micrococcal nuclease